MDTLGLMNVRAHGKAQTKSPEDTYRAYMECLNERELTRLGDFVAEDVKYNGQAVGLDGYRKMISRDLDDIPDLHFVIDLLIADVSRVAARLRFDCHPREGFLGLAVNGRHVVFHENVIYRFAAGRIAEVWSVIDKMELETQLAELWRRNRGFR